MYKDLAKRRESNRKYYYSKPEVRERKRYITYKNRIKRLFGMSLDDYAAVFKEQGGRCKICPETDKLVIDHDHVTGKVRGILCRKCNHGLGCFRDNTDYLKGAIDYLNASKEIPTTGETDELRENLEESYLDH